jgi:DNA polymerase-3 subunit delta
MARTAKPRSSTSKTTTFETLNADFKRGQFAPLYFVYGDEDYQKTVLQEALVAAALQPHEKDFNLDVVYGNESSADAAIGLCVSMPMMADRRVVLVRDFEKLDENERFVAYADRPNPAASVMLVCRGKPNMSRNPYRAIKGKSVAVELEPPKEREMAGWIERYVKRSGGRIEQGAARMLAEVVGTDTQAAVLEIDKLTTFSGGRGLILEDDVLGASGQTREHNVFALQKAVGRADYRRALGIAERLLRQAPDPRGEGIRLVAILAAFVTKLWILSECQETTLNPKELAARVGISSYFIDEYRACLRLYSIGALEDACVALLAADFELKGGAVRDPRLVMNLMLRKMVPARL